MPEQTLTQMLGKYEVFGVSKTRDFTVYRVRNIRETQIQKRMYVSSKFIERPDSDYLFIGNFRSLSCDKKNNYDTSILFIGDSVVQIHINDEQTNLIIYNKDLKKRSETELKLEKILN